MKRMTVICAAEPDRKRRKVTCEDKARFARSMTLLEFLDIRGGGKNLCVSEFRERHFGDQATNRTN